MKQITIDYQEQNDKYYITYDGVWIGKHYNIEEACEQIIRKVNDES